MFKWKEQKIYAEGKIFDPEQLELETLWLKKRENAELLTVATSDPKIEPILWSVIFTLLFGSFAGMAVLYLSHSFILLGLTMLLTFIVLYTRFAKPYAVLEFDPKSKNFLYKGFIEFAGSLQSIRYLGPIDIIEGLEIVSRKHRYYIRFITNSGYLRMPFRGLSIHVQRFLIRNDLLTESEFSLPTTVISTRNKWKIYLEKSYDRSAYFAQLKRKKQQLRSKHRDEKQKQLEEQYKQQHSNL